jgi:ubiquitin-protein ligase E3 A
MFEFVGMLLGLSIYNTTLLDLKFPKLLYRKLMMEKGMDELEELAEIEPDYYKSFRYILDTQDDLAGLELFFEAETEVLGTKVKYPLKPHGELIRLNQANKHDYVKLYSHWLVHDSI